MSTQFSSCHWRARSRSPRIRERFCDFNEAQLYVVNRLETLVRIFFQTRTHQPAQRSGRHRLQRADWHGIHREYLADDARLRFALKGVLARRHFVQQQSKCENVRANIGFESLNLLWRHVLHRAEDGAHAG